MSITQRIDDEVVICKTGPFTETAYLPLGKWYAYFKEKTGHTSFTGPFNSKEESDSYGSKVQCSGEFFESRLLENE